MRIKNEKYEKWGELSQWNKEILKEANECVCYDCFARFNYDYLNDGDWTIDESCICPYCCVDSVIPAVIDGYRLTDEDIEGMNKYWFGFLDE